MSIPTKPESLLISQVLDSVKSATGLGQSNTERAADDAQRGASNMAQGAKDEFNNVCTLLSTTLDLTTQVASGLRDGPSTGSAPSSGGGVRSLSCGLGKQLIG